MSFFTRIFQRLHCLLLNWFSYPVPRQYVEHKTKDQVVSGTPYLLIEYINPSRGKMLFETRGKGRRNLKLRTNLFHSLCRIILDLTRTPLPKIGSLILDEQGYLSLANRPLTFEIQQLENEHIPVGIPKSIT